MHRVVFLFCIRPHMIGCQVWDFWVLRSRLEDSPLRNPNALWATVGLSGCGVNSFDPFDPWMNLPAEIIKCIAIGNVG